MILKISFRAKAGVPKTLLKRKLGLHSLYFPQNTLMLTEFCGEFSDLHSIFRLRALRYWPMSHAKRVTRDNWKNPEYHIIAALRNLRTDTNCPAGKSWPNHVKNEQHIGSEKTYGPQKNTRQ